MYQKTILIGGVGKYVNFLPSNSDGKTAIIEFSIVTTEDRFNKQTQQYDQLSEWHTVKAFGKIAESINNNYSPGDIITVEGRLKTEVYTKNGVQKEIKKLIINEFPKKLPKFWSKNQSMVSPDSPVNTSAQAHPQPQGYITENYEHSVNNLGF